MSCYTDKRNRVLILKSNKDSFERYFIEKMNNDYCTTMPYYSPIVDNRWIHYIAVLWMQKIRFPFQSIWYGKWKRSLKKYDLIILFDRIWGYDLIRYIRKKNKKCRIIFWYWNTVAPKKRIPKDIRRYCEEWSFDQNDCKKYGFKYNTQFFFKQLIKDEISIDTFFVGKDKNRIEDLIKLKEKIKRAGCSSEFYIQKDSSSSKEKYSDYYDKPMDYNTCLKKISMSKCIIEWNKEEQSGLTMRALEAIFFSKKLLTNNTTIQQESFYNTDNILIYKENLTSEAIRNFINSNYKKLDDQIIEKYCFESWLDRF